MRNYTSEALAKLEAGWPEWKIWWVPRAIDGHLSWHAHRRDDERHVLDAGSAIDLEARLAEQEG